MTGPASAVVLAGGASRRMGQDKRAIQVAAQHSLLEQTVERLRTLSDDVVVVGTNVPPLLHSDAARTIADAVPGRGPLGGIVAGLRAARHERVIVVACDLPFLNPAALQAMLDRPGPIDLLVPRRADGTLEMLHAVYQASVRDVAAQLLAANRLKLAELADTLVADGRIVQFLDDEFFRPVDRELRTFFNVNTPADLADARRQLEDSIGGPGRPALS